MAPLLGNWRYHGNGFVPYLLGGGVVLMSVSSSEMTYIVLGGSINSTQSLTLMSSPELI